MWLLAVDQCRLLRNTWWRRIGHLQIKRSSRTGCGTYGSLRINVVEVTISLQEIRLDLSMFLLERSGTILSWGFTIGFNSTGLSYCNWLIMTAFPPFGATKNHLACNKLPICPPYFKSLCTLAHSLLEKFTTVKPALTKPLGLKQNRRVNRGAQ